MCNPLMSYLHYLTIDRSYVLTGIKQDGGIGVTAKGGHFFEHRIEYGRLKTGQIVVEQPE